MNIITHLSSIPTFKNAVVTIGTFDGVHKGHQKVIQQLVLEAKKRQGETVLISFSPHPQQVITSAQSPIQLLTNIEERTALLKQAGIQHLIIIPFDQTFASMTAEEYILHFLHKKIDPSCIIIGYDHKFGKNRKGDFTLLKSFGEKLQFDVKEIDKAILNEITISSTQIRQYLQSYQIIEATQLLGRPYAFTGTVVKGMQLGRKIGTPTANLMLKDAGKLVPSNGVYAVTCYLTQEKKIFKGIMNIGTRPTVDGIDRTIEVNIFDFDRDIYDQDLTVEVQDFIRKEQKFENLEALKMQIAHDKAEAALRLSKMIIAEEPTS